MAVCPDNVHWSECVQQVIAAINAAETPQEAFAAAEIWATRYQRLYEANAQNHWTVAESQQFEEAVREEIGGQIDEWADPANIAFSQALARYFPKLAALFGYLDHPVTRALSLIISPAPLANDFVAATPFDKDVNDALRRKISPHMRPTWEASYVESIQQGYLRVKGTPILH